MVCWEDRGRRDPPFLKSFLRTGNRALVILFRSGTDAGQSPTIDGRNLVKFCTATAPRAAKDAIVFVSDAKFFQNSLHKVASVSLAIG